MNKKSILSVLVLFTAGFMLAWRLIPAEIAPGVFQGEKTAFEESPGALETDEKNVSESWMGIYMNGTKIGYSYSKEYDFYRDGKKMRGSRQESLMKVSRLGGAPVSISTQQESVHDVQGHPLKTVLKTRMSASETVIKAEIGPDTIVFESGGGVTRDLAYEKPVYLGVPLKKIADEEGLSPGKRFDFTIVEPMTQSLVNAAFEVLDKESILVLGEKKDLWRVRTEMKDPMPVVVDEWVDDEGIVWKSVSHVSFLHTVSIKMSKEKALETGDENLDIAFSVLIESNVLFADPQKVRRVSFKISGIPQEKIAEFPYDGTSLKLIEKSDAYAVIQTRSVIFSNKEAVDFPVEGESLEAYLRPTIFCQTDDRDIAGLVRRIVGEETNSWIAAKRIAEWVSSEIKPNYDVGFASAKEILENREGDCTEHTVIMVTLCRAVGIPARAAVGIMYGDGVFAYHMWPEVYVGRWIALDAKWLALDEDSGEYYTDATHLKFGHSALDTDLFNEMGRAMSEIIGRLELEILDYFPK